MSLVTVFSIISGSEPVQQTTLNPIWVPVSLLVLMVLLFVWGLTRGNVKDENLPDANLHEAAGSDLDHGNH